VPDSLRPVRWAGDARVAPSGGVKRDYQLRTKFRKIIAKGSRWVATEVVDQADGRLSKAVSRSICSAYARQVGSERAVFDLSHVILGSELASAPFLGR
jgi:hypothetical protein